MWRALAEIHRTPSRYYDVERFRAGELSLRTIERAEVGDVRGKSLLHLQCHFGLDTLSWARLGARVTGVDFCEEALARGRELAAECGLEAEFVCADLDSLPTLGRTFDVVFTSYGTTVWLPDLTRWAALIARSLAPGGMFYIADGHPFSVCLSNRGDPSTLRVARPYLQPEPQAYTETSDYAVPDAHVSLPGYEWTHTLGEIVTALAEAGLRIAFLHEFPCADSPYFEGMKQDEQGWWVLEDSALRIPHTYSIKAFR
jgi:SAM-dependent methyltransferase